MVNIVQEVFISYDQYTSLMEKITQLPVVCSELKLIENMPQYENIIMSSLHVDIVGKIKSLRENSNVAALIIRGLPYDLIPPPTPYSNQQDLETILISAIINMGIYQLLKLYPVTYEGENNGRLFHHVVPKKQAIYRKTSQGSHYSLGMHADNCFLPFIAERVRDGYSVGPEFLSLFGLRCDLHVPTRIVALDDILDKLDNSCITQLMKAEYRVRTPDSFSHRLEFNLPLLVKDESGIFYCRFDQDFVTPENENAKKAFERFKQACDDNDKVLDLILQPGDFLIFKNQQVIHGRNSFAPRFDGRDRWLLRLFGVSDIQRIFPVDNTNSYHAATIDRGLVEN